MLQMCKALIVYFGTFYNALNVIKLNLILIFFFSVIYKLLASKSEGIRVQTLKVMGYFLKHLPPK